MKIKFTKKDYFSALIIVIIFLIIAFLAVLTYRFNYAKTDFQAETKFAAMQASEELPLQEDLNRFLQVYFEQQFENSADRLRFLQIEYRRFSFIIPEEEDQLEWKKILIQNLGSILNKLQSGNTDLNDENTALAQLRQQLVD